MKSNGFFAVGIWHPKHEQNIGTLFRSALAFGAAFVFTVGRRYKKQSSDVSNTTGEIPLFHYADVKDLIEHLPNGCPLVGVELAHGLSEPLTCYDHPKAACYLLGAEDHGLSYKILRRCHKAVWIPGASACLNVASAGTVVMYDRMAKGVAGVRKEQRDACVPAGC